MASIHRSPAYNLKTQQLIDSKTKVCIKCGVEKDKSNFTTDRGHRDRKHPVCNECKKLNQRALYRKQPHLFYAAQERARKKNPEAVRARTALNHAVKSGLIIKSLVCQKCSISGVRIEGHHWKGYDKDAWLDVIWLCVPCHKQEDAVR